MIDNAVIVRGSDVGVDDGLDDQPGPGGVPKMGVLASASGREVGRLTIDPASNKMVVQRADSKNGAAMRVPNRLPVTPEEGAVFVAGDGLAAGFVAENKQQESEVAQRELNQPLLTTQGSSSLLAPRGSDGGTSLPGTPQSPDATAKG